MPTGQHSVVQLTGVQIQVEGMTRRTSRSNGVFQNNHDFKCRLMELLVDFGDSCATDLEMGEALSRTTCWSEVANPGLEYKTRDALTQSARLPAAPLAKAKLWQGLNSGSPHPEPNDGNRLRKRLNAKLLDGLINVRVYAHWKIGLLASSANGGQVVRPDKRAPAYRSTGANVSERRSIIEIGLRRTLHD